MSLGVQCQECGATIADGALLGLCPRCLLRLGEQFAGQESATGALDPIEEDRAGARVGRYRLLERVGEGGFGSVWKAEQLEPVKRFVAVKVVKLGMDTREVIARFEAERQALAMMDHPGIAKVFDAGATAGGRPFFVMELVDGIPITEYCRRNELNVKERLRLFTDVCGAVQHAHQKGVIHRDLKPSNVLVSAGEGTLMPKVIDFGFAKATQQELTEKTIFTQYGHFLGTPAYISPEQSDLSGLDIDTRSDIYSLGVLLYELLTGVTPFDTPSLMSGGLENVSRVIREQEPMRPSARVRERLSRNEQGDKITRRVDCRSSPIDDDLDWIVMKCLEKDRGRRYATANGLAMDLERYLRHEPVLARPPSMAYRLRRTWSRHRVGLAAILVVLVALLAALFTSLWQARIALAAKETADMELRKSLLGQARLARFSQSPGSRDLALEALSRGAAISPGADLLQDAVTSLALFQVRDLGIQIPNPEGQSKIAFDLEMTRYVWHGLEQDFLEVRSLVDHGVVRRFEFEEPDFVDHLAWMPDGDRLLLRFRQGALEQRRVSTGARLWLVENPKVNRGLFEANVGEMAVDPSGQFISAVEPGGKVRVLRSASGEVYRVFSPADNPAFLAFHPSRPWIAIAGEMNLTAWDFEENREIASRFVGSNCRSIDWSNDGNYLAYTAYTVRMELLQGDVAGGDWRHDHRVEGLGGHLSTVRFSPLGPWLAQATTDGLLTIRDVQSARPLLDGLAGFPVRFDSKGDRLYCLSGLSQGVRVYEISPSDCYLELHVPFWADESLPGIAISPDDDFLAATSYSTGLFVWELADRTLIGHDSSFTDLHSPFFAESGRKLLVCSEKGIFHWDWHPGGAIGSEANGASLLQQGFCMSARRPTFTAGRERSIVVPLDQNLCVIDENNCTSRQVYRSRGQDTAAVSLDGRWLAESSFHSPVIIRDLVSEAKGIDSDRVLPCQGGLVSFSPDGRYLMVGRSGSVDAWEVDGWKLAWSLPTKTINPSSGHCFFRPQGDILVTLVSPTDLLLVRVSDGSPLLRLVAPAPGPISRYTFSSSGRLIAASNEDGRVQVWRLDRLERRLRELGLDWSALVGMPEVNQSDEDPRLGQ